MANEVQPEDVLMTLGGCGKFQIVLSLVIHVMKIVVCFSQSNMVFSAKVPQWWCADGLDLDQNHFNGTDSVRNSSQASNYSHIKQCRVNNGEQCSSIEFDPETNTIVSEFHLVCDSAWIPATVMSIQMAGVFTGNFVSGHIADGIGRKKPFFLSMFILCVGNIVGAFSTTWIMFAVCRFFIGMGSGFFLTIQYSILSEFTLAKWRSWVIGFPSWHVQMCLFALTCWLLKDWKYLQLVTGLLAIPSIAAWWFIPESFRWYISHDRNEEAEEVVKFVARINNHPLEDISNLHLQGGATKQTSSQKLTALSLFKTKQLAKLTCSAIIIWFGLGFVAYGIQFSIPTLSGSVYFNFCLFAMISAPAKLASIYLQNRFGRKATILLIYGISAVGATIAGALHYIDVPLQSKLITVFSLLCYAMNAAAWGTVQTITIEMYPTVIRNIGFGFLSVFARAGAVIGPQVTFLSTLVPGLLYFVCGAITGVGFFTTLGLPETRKANLKDKIKRTTGTKTVENVEMDIKAP